MSYSNFYAASGLFHGSMAAIMGTQLDILMTGGEAAHLNRVWETADTEVRRIDKMLSRFDPESEVARLNREAGRYPVTVSEEMWRILQACKQYHALTEGLFDITLQGFGQVLLSERERSVFFLSESLHIDLGGFGKGYALARLRELLERHGIRKALVNFGNSSVLAVGSHPFGDYWPVGLDNPFTERRITDLRLCDTSLSVSGNTPFHTRHIVNPLTGKSVEAEKLVFVVAKDPVAAEILSTAFMVADDSLIPVIASRFDIEEKQVYRI